MAHDPSPANVPGPVPVSVACNAFGELVLTDAAGRLHTGVVPARAFPLAAPHEGLSLLDTAGREVAWIADWAVLPPDSRAVVERELAAREFAPVVHRIAAVSTFSTPSTWTVDTDCGPTDFVLKSEDDIRRLPGGALLVAAGHGVQFRIDDVAALDRPSRRLLERFL